MPEAGFVFDLYSANPWLYQSGTTYFWDPVAAAILSDGSLAQYEQRGLCVVEEEGPTSGQIKIASGCPLVRAALFLDRERFESLFLDVLNTQINMQP
jgi:inosine-uridine nucleoside N-ribohydrolase